MVLDRHGLELYLPSLFDTTADAIDEHNLPFSEALAGNRLAFMDRHWLHSWLDRAAAEFDKARSVL